MVICVEYSFTIPGRLDGLNDYTAANRTNPHKGGKAKRDNELLVISCIRHQLRGIHITDPVLIYYHFYEKDMRRDGDNIVSCGAKFIQDSLTKTQVLQEDNRKCMYDIINSNVKSWYDGLSFPMTLKAFRDSFFAHLGIEQKETSLVNDSMTVNKTLVTTQSDDSSVTAEATISGKTIIEAICEINGAFGNIGRDGKFEYVILKAITSALYPAEDLYPREDLFPSDANTESMTGHYITFDYEAFQSQAITQLEIRADDSTAGAIVGASGNNYVISGNFLISDKTGAEMKQIANNLLSVIAQAEYTPIKSCTCVGNPCLELGDPIRFNTSREIVETYILQRTLTGVQSKRDSIVSAGTEIHAMKIPTTRETVEALKRRTHILEENADHLQSTYEDLEDQTNSKFEQTAESITAEVKRATDAEGELGASLELKVGRDENDQVVSMINASADQIVLRGNRLIVECNNFELDALGRVHIVDSLLYDSDNDNGTVEILTHDGRFRPLLQNVRLDTGSVLTPDGASLATEYDINAINSSFANYAKKTDLPQGYITSASYSWSDRSTTKYAPRHFNAERNFGASSATLDIEGLLISLSGSDKRLKENIHPLRDIKGVYMAMCPVEYTWKDGYITQHKGLQFGLIAQDLEKILDDAGLSDSGLVLRENAEEDEKAIHGDSKTWKIDKENLHAMHIQMIQMQQKEIELLKQKNEELERRLSALERK